MCTKRKEQLHATLREISDRYEARKKAIMDRVLARLTREQGSR